MNFLSYLSSKRNLIILWTLFHGIALFVNTFEIEICSNKIESSNNTNYAPTFRRICILCNSSRKDVAKSEFWPFVQFYVDNLAYENEEDKRRNDVYISMGKGSQIIKRFGGVFYQYDISEFIAYSILLLLILYFKWSLKSNIR